MATVGERQPKYLTIYEGYFFFVGILPLALTQANAWREHTHTSARSAPHTSEAENHAVQTETTRR